MKKSIVNEWIEIAEAGYVHAGMIPKESSEYQYWWQDEQDKDETLGCDVRSTDTDVVINRIGNEFSITDNDQYWGTVIFHQKGVIK